VPLLLSKELAIHIQRPIRSVELRPRGVSGPQEMLPWVKSFKIVTPRWT
jgi:hypothetical protein